MEIDDFKKLATGNKRSEEVQHIIERMPTKFGIVVSWLVISIFLITTIFGFIISYPDVVAGNITISSLQPPVKLIDLSPGKIRLLTRSQQSVKAGTMLGYVDNSANVSDVMSLKEKLKIFNFKLPEKKDQFLNVYNLGEITPKYYDFISALQNFRIFYDTNIYDKEIEDLKISTIQQRASLLQLIQQLDFQKKNLQLIYKSFRRDSTLYIGRVESEAEYEKSKMNYYNFEKSFHDALNGILQQKQQIAENDNKSQQLTIQKGDKQEQIKTALASTYNNLLDNIRSWEQKYTFISPLDGKVQFLSFWTENEYVAQGQEVFTIIPADNRLTGELVLPSSGAGKVKVGQDVIIKLENYPSQEFGTIKGKVKSISLTTNLTKGKDNQSISNYLVFVDLPDNLRTNFGSKIISKIDLKGTADIITRDRKLIERLFDNLKYVANN